MRRRKDGSLVDISLTISPVVDFQGRIAGASKIAQSISERKRAEAALRDHAHTLTTVNRVATVCLATDLDLELLGQTVTDAGVELTRTQTGAFFYKVTNEDGETGTVHAVSDGFSEAFSGFPMPGDTLDFGPTSRGEGVVRSDDITVDVGDKSTHIAFQPLAATCIGEAVFAPALDRTHLLASSMETWAFRIKLKPNSIHRVREWAGEIMRRQQEALETLRDESVLLENFFLEQAEDGDYLIGVMTAESFDRSQASVRESKHDIDSYHQQFKRDTWESGEPLERLVDLNRLREPPKAGSQGEEK